MCNMYARIFCLAIFSSSVCYASDACYTHELEQILTQEAQELLSHRITADAELPYTPQYMWWFSPHDIYNAIRVKVCNAEHDVPSSAYDIELNAAVADVWVAPYQVQHLCACSGDMIKKCLGCCATIYVTDPDVFSDELRRKFFIYHRLAYIRQAYNSIADGITHLIANPSASRYDTRLFSSLCIPSPSMLLHPETTHTWYRTILQEITYRCYLHMHKPITCDMELADYWDRQRKSISSHIKTLSRCERVSIAYPHLVMPTKRRIDAYVDALAVAPVVSSWPPDLSSYDEITRLRNGEVLPSLIYYHAALRHIHPGWQRTYHV